jgi:glycosyltransferase involved in cell wall biosynthesis
VSKYRIVGTCQIYNEIRKDNLERFVNYFLPLVDDLVVYDDGSTDGSYEYMLQSTSHVIRDPKNDFTNERHHKQILLQKALELKPDFILWLDADEVLSANAGIKLPELCEYCIQNEVDGLSFHEINLWRSYSWRRMDSLFNDGWFVRLWRVTSEMEYSEIKPGLHQAPYPSTIKIIEIVPDVQVLHYGFSSEKRLAYKYLLYQAHGQSGYIMLDRLVNEQFLVLEQVAQELFPAGLWVDDPKPKTYTLEQSMAYVEKYRKEVFWS